MFLKQKRVDDLSALDGWNTVMKIHSSTTSNYFIGPRLLFPAGKNDITFLFLLLFQDGCSLVNGIPNHQQQQQQQQLTLILLFGNHCRMGHSAQVKTDY